MSKRPFFPQQGGDRKKAKLDVTISDHNFPLSQNGPNKEKDQNTWGDDNDDEILLLASQVCEEAYNEIGSIPDYSICMQPPSTSTQLFDPGPSTSKTAFNFKKPSAILPSAISSNLKDKCNRISSPLPHMSSKILPKNSQNFDLTDDLIFNDKIYKGQDSDVIYKQLLQLQEENTKLKSENGKLLEKCVTKEGEASILRTQLKTYQVSVDNAKMEKIKAQEKIQMEYSEKLLNVNSQMHELRTQLDFKNLEIISIKERCKLLESNKIKLTQVTVTNNDISSSQRINNNFSTKDHRKPKLTSNSVQTDDKEQFLKLNKTCRTEPSPLTPILPQILESTANQLSLLEYNEKLQKHPDFSHNKCRVFSTFHRIPTTASCKEVRLDKVTMSSLYEDLTKIAAGVDDGRGIAKLLSTVTTILEEVKNQLELISRKMTTAFQKEMDEKYIDATTAYLQVTERDLLSGRALYKEEQAILARRIVTVLAFILKSRNGEQLWKNQSSDSSHIPELILRICSLLDSTSCALPYSGFLLSATYIINNLQIDNSKIIEIIKNIISSRPMPFVSCQLLKLLRKLFLEKSLLEKVCLKSSVGNLKLDYDQGVLLYKKDSCHLQILLKQVEWSLKCMLQHKLTHPAAAVASNLLALHSNINSHTSVTTSCDCQLVLLQVIVYALRTCAVMVTSLSAQDPSYPRLLAVCASGTVVLYQHMLRDVGLTCRLPAYEGHLLEFSRLRVWGDLSETHTSMLAELSSSFQSSPEDASTAFHREPWVNSFKNFTVSD